MMAELFAKHHGSQEISWKADQNRANLEDDFVGNAFELSF